MSDNFIPLNQSTPVQERWNHRNQNYSGYQNSWQHNSNRNRSQQKWGNNSRKNNSFGSESNSSYGMDKSSIDAYLHPSMLQDPWAHLRKNE